MRPCNHWTYTWPTTTVGDAEGLVEVEVAYISTELAKLCIADNGIGVSAVDVDLTTCCVNQIADLNNRLFVDAVGPDVLWREFVT